HIELAYVDDLDLPVPASIGHGEHRLDLALEHVDGFLRHLGACADPLLQAAARQALGTAAGEARENVADLVAGEALGRGAGNEIAQGTVSGTADADAALPTRVAGHGAGALGRDARSVDRKS